MSAPIFNVPSLKDFKKIGFIVPSSNVALEIVTSAIMTQLPLVSVHYSRIPVTTTDLNAGAASQFTAEALLQVAKLIANCPVETILWNGTSESWTGEGYKAGVHIKDVIEKGTLLPASTSSLAQVDVLKLWGLKKIALATPYTAEPNKRLYEYYKSVGIEVVNDSRLDHTVNNEFADTPVDRIRQLIRDADHPDAECIVIPCTNFPAAVLVEDMELELGKPIFDSIIVTLWKALRLINVTTPIHGWGRLLRDDPVLRKLDEVMDVLRVKTGGSRTTLRMDDSRHNCHVDRVAAESLAPGIPSLRPNTSLNQRALKTCIYLNETGEALVQPDTINAPIAPPKALMTVYGVKAQMLIPLMSPEGEAGAWISVHYVPSTREWSESDVAALHSAGRDVCDILRESGWAEYSLKRREQSLE
jgi:maleate isomerase